MAEITDQQIYCQLMKTLKHKPVGEDLGNHGIRKHPTAVTPIQFRFGKGSRKSKPFEKLFKSAAHKSVIIKEVVTGDQAEFVVLFY